MVGLPTAEMHFSRQSELAQNNVKRRQVNSRKNKVRKMYKTTLYEDNENFFLITFDLQEGFNT